MDFSPLPVQDFSANVLAFILVHSRFAWMSWQIGAKHIYVLTTIATKVDALTMSADMCMNNVTSACVVFITNAPCCIM